jgi:hypothetical protein
MYYLSAVLRTRVYFVIKRPSLLPAVDFITNIRHKVKVERERERERERGREREREKLGATATELFSLFVAEPFGWMGHSA